MTQCGIVECIQSRLCMRARCLRYNEIEESLWFVTFRSGDETANGGDPNGETFGQMDEHLHLIGGRPIDEGSASSNFTQVHVEHCFYFGNRRSSKREFSGVESLHGGGNIGFMATRDKYLDSRRKSGQIFDEDFEKAGVMCAFIQTVQHKDERI
jgi:hypothetical protein